MNTIFKYNANRRHSTENLKGGYNRNNFSLLDVYVYEKGLSMKFKLPNIFKDHHIVAKPSPTTIGFVLNSRYPLLFGQNFIIVIVNTSLN